MNNEWAMAQLRTFIASAQYTPGNGGYSRHVAFEEQIVAQAQVIEQIFDRVIRDWREEDTVKKRRSYFDHWDAYRHVAHRALAQLQRENELAENLGDGAPSLNATKMHRWVWDGERSPVGVKSFP